jgi:hypothetical protein
MLQHNMRGTDTRAGEAVSTTIAAMTRATSWRLIDEIPLRFDAHHPQGMARVGGAWWISTVDIEARHGYVLSVDDEGRLIDRTSVGDEVQHHPGGMDFDGEALWIAAAEYRPDSSATIYRMEPGGPPERAFAVDDHVGAIARCGHDGDLVGWSWGSRRFYRWSVAGTLLASRQNPSFFVDHQDCQWLGDGRLLCSGVAAVELAAGPGWLGGVGLLHIAELTMEREVPFPVYSPDTGRPATHNPTWTEVDGDRLVMHVLPDDGSGVLRSYATPLAS